MGDEVLKKIIYVLPIVTILFVSNIFASSNLVLGNETKEYDKIFTQINQTRVGISLKKINKLKNPFLTSNKKTVLTKKAKKARKKKAYFILDAIFDKKAKINGKWVRLYSKIGSYKLVKIKRSSVILKNNNGKKEIFIRKKDDKNIKFSIN